MQFEHHRISEIFPLVDRDTDYFRGLVEDIRLHGVAQPVVLYENKILDGRHRVGAAEVAGVEPPYIEFTGTPEEAISYVWSLNDSKLKRQLTSSQRAACDALRNKLLDSYQTVREAAKARQRATSAGAPRNEKGQVQPVPQLIAEPEGDGLNNEVAPNPKATETREVRAKAAGTNREYIDMADKLLKEEPEVFAEVQKGHKSLTEVRRERFREVRNVKSKPAKKKRPRPAKEIAVRGGKSNQRIRDSVMKCAQKKKALAYPEIATLTGYAISYMDEFVTFSQLLPWVNIKVVYPENGASKPRGKYDRLGRYQFSIDEELKDICEGRSNPTAHTSVLAKVKNLYQGIVQRREEIQQRERDTNWSPDLVSRIELARILDYFQEQLAHIINPD